MFLNELLWMSAAVPAAMARRKPCPPDLIAALQAIPPSHAGGGTMFYTPSFPMVGGFFRRGRAVYRGSSRCARPLPSRLAGHVAPPSRSFAQGFGKRVVLNAERVGGHPPLPTTFAYS